MTDQKRFLVDVGMKNLPFPMRVVSQAHDNGQYTIANISINARIMHEFEAIWIDKFIQILHLHREIIGTDNLRKNILDYANALEAKSVKIDFDYPFFVEKLTPITKEKCLVKYNCKYSVKTPSIDENPRILFSMDIPVITTYPTSSKHKVRGLFGQLSTVNVKAESQVDLYPEHLVELVDNCALAPIYSFLLEEDQDYLIEKIHTDEKTSLVMMDEIKNQLSKISEIDWFSVQCSNHGMLHSYSTVIGTEKSWWVPFSGIEDSDL